MKYNKGDKCSVEGCKNVVTSMGYVKGQKYYRSVCHKHHWEKQVSSECSKRRKEKQKYKFARWRENNPDWVENYLEIDITKCSICGWNKAHCDVHRIKYGKYGGKYEKNNVLVLCPNCHRLVHRGLIKI